MTASENNDNRSLVDHIFNWWAESSLAGKFIALGLILIWLVFIMWLAISQNETDQPTQEIYIPAVSDDRSAEDANSDERSSPTLAIVLDESLLAGATLFEINAEESVAAYSAVEEFFGDSGLIVGRNTNQGINTAVGETRGLSGSFYLDLEKGSPKIIGGEFSADLQQLSSVQPHRDDMLKRFWLASNTYPTARFVITEIPTLPPAYQQGTRAAFPLTGILTVRDIEKEVTFDVVATLENGSLDALAVTNLLFEDFGIAPPNMAGVLQVEPDFKLIVSVKAESQPNSGSEK
ncbi:MAG: YceI family protein [Chloroflexota bacterium]